MAELDKPLADETAPPACSSLCSGPPALAFLPALCLAAYWFGGEGALIVCRGALPLSSIWSVAVCGQSTRLILHGEAVNGLLQRNAFEELTEEIYARTSQVDAKSATFFDRN